MEVDPAAQRNSDPARQKAELEACLAGQRAKGALDARLLEHARVKHAVSEAQRQLEAQRFRISADEVGAGGAGAALPVAACRQRRLCPDSFPMPCLQLHHPSSDPAA